MTSDAEPGSGPDAAPDAAPGREQALAEVRAGIDRLDRDLVALIAQREQLVRRAGLLKQDAGAVRAPARVEQVIDRVRALAEEAAASPDVVERTYRAMIAAFVDLELGVHAEAPRRQD